MSAPQITKPTTTAQLVEAVIHARQIKNRVRILGLSTLEHLVPRPRPGTLLLSTRALNTIDVTPNDLVAHVGPGLDLKTLDAHLQAAGLFWPVSRLEAPGTIGGIIGSGRATASSAADGPARRWVLGAQLVNGLGQTLTVGGATVKNSVGYGLTHALWGSHGQLGAIIRLTLRLRTRTGHDAIGPEIRKPSLLQTTALLRCENLAPGDTNQVLDQLSMAKTRAKANDQSRIIALYDQRTDAELAAANLNRTGIDARVEPLTQPRPASPAHITLRASLDPYGLFV